MQITADFNTDDIVQEVMNSSEFDSHVNGLIDSLLTEQIEEHIGNIDIDDIGDFERRAEEIARDVATDILDDEVGGRVRDAVDQAMADVADPQDSDDRIAELERKVEHLTDALESVISILSLAGKVVTPSI